MNKNPAAQYLSQFAEPEARLVAGLLKTIYQHCLIIPAYDESCDFLMRLQSQLQQHAVLLIVVINQPESDEQELPQQMLWEYLQHLGQKKEEVNNLSLISVDDGQSSVLVINRFSTTLRIPDKQGVGLARKIATDCAVAAINAGFVKSSAICSSDADAHLPHNYFAAATLGSKSSAGVFGFEHVAVDDSQVNTATQLYEKRLHYYVNGLSFAGSPYAFHTIGSCLLIDAVAYCKVRGFPKRAGGEDFYLLNKLAKVGEIETVAAQVAIQSRVSQRVPFGTGPAVQEIIRGDLNLNTYMIYDPHIFQCLKSLLQEFCQITPDKLPQLEAQLSIDSFSRAFLTQSGFFSTAQKWHRQRYSQAQLQKTLTDWFDAFRTLKYVHFLRENRFSDIPLIEALRLAPWN